jgi:cytidylate kinase
MKIAISGKSGCGNTTVSKLVADRLNYQFINFTFRNLAAENNTTLEQLLASALTDDKWDREVDRRQIELAEQAGNCVLGSRLAIWLLKSADIKVYLNVDSATRVGRIVKREGGDFKAVEDFTSKRDVQDTARYKHLYDIDNNDFSFADLVIDAGHLTPDEIADIIINKSKS